MRRKRTAGMTVIAVLDCVFGLLTFLMAVAGILSALGAARQAIVIEGSMGIAGITRPQQAAAVTLLGMSLWSLLIAVAALLAGTALFFMWRRARTLNLFYAWLAVAKGVALFIFPALAGPHGGIVPGLGARAFGLLLGLIYPIVLILLFARSDWKPEVAAAAR